MHRIFIEPKEIEKDKIIIKDENFHHLKNVLRLQLNDDFIACDGEQNDYLVKIEKIYSREIIGKIVEKKLNLNEPSVKITLAQSLLKKDKFDVIVDFSVQLGIYKIIPFVSSRTIAKENRNIDTKIKRWQKISQEAAQLSRGIIPQIDKVYSWEELLKTFDNFDYVILPWEEEKENFLRDVIFGILRTSSKNPPSNPPFSKGGKEQIKKILLIIGPEGGFTKQETESAKPKGAHVVTLGPRIMKAEVAAVYSLSTLLSNF